MKINELINKLEQEIKVTQNQHDQALSLARLKDIAKVYEGEDEVISFDDIKHRILTAPDELKIMSGWEGLDNLLKGFRLQQLVVVSALTKSGKTSFLMDLTTRIRDHHPMWFPFEESAEELIRKFIEYGQEPPQAFTPKSITDNKVQWLETKIVESIAKYGTKVVFIDQLDFIIPYNGDNHSLRVAQTMRDLKHIAKKWNVVIFLICHLVKTKMSEQPTLEDLRGSSAIGQEADTVILLWREMKKEGGQVIITDNVNVSVQANRRTGKTGNVKMVYDRGRFIEQEWKSEKEEEAESDKKYKDY